MTASPLDKEEKKAKASLNRLIQHVKMEWSMRRIKTLLDYFHALGYDDNYIKGPLSYYDSELQQTLTWPEVKERLSDLQIALNVEWFLLRNPPPTTSMLEIATKPMEVVPSVEIDTLKKATVRSENDTQDGTYGLWPSERENTLLYWFQKKAAKALLDGLEITPV